MNFSIFKKIFDKLHLSFLFKTGDKRTTNMAAGRDINNLMVLITPEKTTDVDHIAQKAQKLIKGSDKVSSTDIAVVLGTFLGIVKSAEKPGTRVHLDFAVLNKDEIHAVLQGVYIKINEGIVHFKKFYKSNSNGSREPDMAESFPIIIAAKAATKLQIEFENIAQKLIKKGKNEGEVVILTENNKIARKKFDLEVDDAMIEVFKQSQISADKTVVPSIFLATIQS